MQYRREDYVELMTFGRTDRPMFCELFGLLIGLDTEWRSQGATAAELDLTAFDWDWVPVARCGGSTGAFGGPAGRVLEETGEYVIRQDMLGRRTKLIKSAATIALPLDFPVRNMDDWLRLKPLFQFTEQRIDWTAVESARAAQANGALVAGGMPGGFDVVRELMGEENACLAYYDQPELVADILATCGDTCVAVFERISPRVALDQLSVHEDLAGKSGPLIGPRQFRQFVTPYYRRVWDAVRSFGTRLFDIDSDGNVNPLIDALIESGINSMHPNEPAAGMDIVAVRKAYGRRLAVKGGIDKHVLRRSKPEIRMELEHKMQPMMRAGGTIFGLDHRIPNGTPLENYRYYVDTGREILGLPPRGSGRGWSRMAF